MLRPFETMSQQCCDKGDVTRYDSQRPFLAQHKAWQCWNNVVTIQNDNNVAMLFCAKHGCCEFSRVTSLCPEPLVKMTEGDKRLVHLHCTTLRNTVTALGVN